jgi:hypothetical protein
MSKKTAFFIATAAKTSNLLHCSPSLWLKVDPYQYWSHADPDGSIYTLKPSAFLKDTTYRLLPTRAWIFLIVFSHEISWQQFYMHISDPLCLVTSFFHSGLPNILKSRLSRFSIWNRLHSSFTSSNIAVDLMPFHRVWKVRGSDLGLDSGFRVVRLLCVRLTTSPPSVSRLSWQCTILNTSADKTSTACYADSFTFLYVDDVRTSQETCLWASTACYGDRFTFYI